MTDDKGAVTGFRGISRDVTERKQAEEKLKESEQKYRLLFETSPDCIAQLDREGRYLAANPAVAKSLGVPLEELIDRTVSEVMPQEVAQHRLEMVRKVLDEWQAQVFEDQRAGRYFHHIIIPTKTSEQKEAVQVITRDITERKQAEQALQKSEERYRVLAENAGEAIFVVQDDVVKFINRKGVELCGYSGEELASRPFTRFIYPDDIHMVADRYLKRLRGELGPQTYDFRIVRKDGAIRWGELNAVSISWEDRPAVLCFMNDVTEHKEAEEALSQSEERYRTILEEMEDAYFEVDLGGHLTFVNNSVCRDLGYSREELIGMSYKGYIVEEDIESVFRVFTEVYRTGVPNKGFPWKVSRKDGSHGFAETSISPLRNDKGEIIGFRGVGRDITERKHAEEVRAEAATRRRILVDQSTDGIVVLDENGKVYEANQRFAQMLGYTPVEVRELYVWDWEYLHPHERVLEMIRSVDEAGDHFETQHRRKDGSIYDVEIGTNGAMFAGQKLVFCVCRDITERKKMEEALRQSEENYRALFDSTVIGTVVLDAETRKIVMANQAAAKIFELSSPEESIGEDPLEFVHPSEKERDLELIVKELFEQDLRTAHEIRAITRDGREIWISATGARIMHEGKLAGLISFTDITEQKWQSERLMVTDRLVSLGELASGTAHELNNPLTSIIGFSQLLMEREVPDDIREDLKLINTEAQRAANVTSNLLTFARKHAPVKQLSQINNIIEDMLKLRAYEHKVNNIGVVKQLHPDLPEMMVDYFQIQQVFMNIIINAEYFMTAAHNRGTLTITTKKQNGTVRISIADDGPGIRPENLKRIFDPFFTTKEAGKGTGLGLSICHGIVTEHGGQIYARSQLGEGATILVELPIDGVQPYRETQ
jgi:two-component system NtrC family sensor kinase